MSNSISHDDNAVRVDNVEDGERVTASNPETREDKPSDPSRHDHGLDDHEAVQGGAARPTSHSEHPFSDLEVVHHAESSQNAADSQFHQAEKFSYDPSRAQPIPGEDAPLHTIDGDEKVVIHTLPATEERAITTATTTIEPDARPLKPGIAPEPEVVPLRLLAAVEAPIDCPICRTRTKTRLRYRSSDRTNLWACVMCFFTGLGCLVYAMKSMRDVKHFCPNCNSLLATWSRSTGDIEIHVKELPEFQSRPSQLQQLQGYSQQRHPTAPVYSSPKQPLPDDPEVAYSQSQSVGHDSEPIASPQTPAPPYRFSTAKTTMSST